MSGLASDLHKIRCKINLDLYKAVVVHDCDIGNYHGKRYPSLAVLDKESDELLYLGHTSKNSLEEIEKDCERFMKDD